MTAPDMWRSHTPPPDERELELERRKQDLLCPGLYNSVIHIEVMLYVFTNVIQLITVFLFL